jgi:hypothetical protein
MATVKVPLELLNSLGISPYEMRPPELGTHTQRRLEALLASRGFNRTAPIRVTELPNGEGFLVTQ